ncbi:MAG TPA: hypothetical protein VGM87_11905 [Roseomonas sp.]|jgi:hypothetical protein
MRLSHAVAAFGLLISAPVLAQTPAPIGVAECDNFATKYEQCLNGQAVPAEQRTTLNAQLTQMRDSLRQAAANPQSRPALATQCTQLSQQMGQMLAAYGCHF